MTLVANVAARLEAGARALDALVGNVDPELARFRTFPGKWSIVEIVGHLYDEEKLDFRVRIDFMLHRPGERWPAIDPEGRVREENYQDRALDVVLAAFMEERRHSLVWLAGLRDADWSSAHRHDTLGEFTAASMLAAWAAHDLLHLRQIECVLHAHLAGLTRPNRLDYAGTW